MGVKVRIPIKIAKVSDIPEQTGNSTNRTVFPFPRKTATYIKPSLSFAESCYALLKLSDLVGYLDATDILTVSTAVTKHIYTICKKVQGAGIGTVRCRRPVISITISIMTYAITAAE